MASGDIDGLVDVLMRDHVKFVEVPAEHEHGLRCVARKRCQRLVELYSKSYGMVYFMNETNAIMEKAERARTEQVNSTEESLPILNEIYGDEDATAMQKSIAAYASARAIQAEYFTAQCKTMLDSRELRQLQREIHTMCQPIYIDPQLRRQQRRQMGDEHNGYKLRARSREPRCQFRVDTETRGFTAVSYINQYFGIKHLHRPCRVAAGKPFGSDDPWNLVVVNGGVAFEQMLGSRHLLALLGNCEGDEVYSLTLLASPFYPLPKCPPTGPKIVVPQRNVTLQPLLDTRQSRVPVGITPNPPRMLGMGGHAKCIMLDYLEPSPDAVTVPLVVCGDTANTTALLRAWDVPVVFAETAGTIEARLVGTGCDIADFDAAGEPDGGCTEPWHQWEYNAPVTVIGARDGDLRVRDRHGHEGLVPERFVFRRAAELAARAAETSLRAANGTDVPPARLPERTKSDSILIVGVLMPSARAVHAIATAESHGLQATFAGRFYNNIPGLQCVTIRMPRQGERRRTVTVSHDPANPLSIPSVIRTALGRPNTVISLESWMQRAVRTWNLHLTQLGVDPSDRGAVEASAERIMSSLLALGEPLRWHTVRVASILHPNLRVPAVQRAEASPSCTSEAQQLKCGACCYIWARHEIDPAARRAHGMVLYMFHQQVGRHAEGTLCRGRPAPVAQWYDGVNAKTAKRAKPGETDNVIYRRRRTTSARALNPDIPDATNVTIRGPSAP